MKRVVITMLSLLFILSLVFASQPEGYSYRITVEVNNPNSYPVYYYALPIELNLQPYTLSDYNDIVVFLGDTKINYSIDRLVDGNVILTLYIPYLQPYSTENLYIYVGKQGEENRAIPKIEAVGKYLAVRVHDSVLYGNPDIPEWVEVTSCYSRNFPDGGRDRFDGYGYPRLYVNSSSSSLYISPYANCNPYEKRINGVLFRYENFAYGYLPSKQSDPHDPPQEGQRIWVQEIVPRCDSRQNSYTIKYELHGNIGYDDSTEYTNINYSKFGKSLKLYRVWNNENNGEPILHFIMLPGDMNTTDSFVVSGSDRIRHTLQYRGIPMPLTYILSFTVDTSYLEQWLDNALYIGEACYVDRQITYRVTNVEHLTTAYFINPPTVIYRTHDVDLNIYYDGYDNIYVVTDWNYTVQATKVDGNIYRATIYVDKNVPVGEHNIYLYEGNTDRATIRVYVDYGGTPNAPNVSIPSNVIMGLKYDIPVEISCSGDACVDVYVSASSSDCVILSEPDYVDLIPEGNTYTSIVSFACYHASQHSITIYIENPLESNQYTYEFNVIDITNMIPVNIDSPDVVDPNAKVPVTVSASGYEGNVTVSLLDKNLNHIVITEANKIDDGVYVAEINLGGLEDGYYYILAVGDRFKVMKVLTVSHTAFMNPFGISVEDQYGKPATLFRGKVSGDYIEYNIDVVSYRNTPYTLDASEVLKYGGLIQVPPEAISILDEMTVTNESNTINYNITYDFFGGSIAVVWHTDNGTLVLNPGDNVFHIRFLSPYVEALKKALIDTNDPVIQQFLTRMYTAQTLKDQVKIYNEYLQYLSTSIYGSVDVSIAVPPSVVQYSTSYGFAYIKNGANLVDPDEVNCNIIGEDGNIVSTCTLQRVDTGVYKVPLKTDKIGVFGISITARKGVYTGRFTAYYSVDSAYKPGEVVVTNFVVPPNGKTMVIYNQDPVATVTLRMFDTSGNLLKTANMAYSDDIGAFVYELNVGDVPNGDYIIVVSDSFGYSDRAIIRVSSILEDILNTVSDVNSFLNNVIAPKLDSIDNKLDTVLDNQTNLYQAIEDVNAQVAQVLNVLNYLEQNIDQYHQDTVQRLEELNDLAHQILQEVLYIKNKIDNVVITKLDLVLQNQEGMQGDLNDIKLMLDCNKPSAVCVQLQNIQLLLNDIQSDLNNHHNEVINRLDRIESKVDTLTDYTDSLRNMLNCEYNYPRTSICAKLDVLEERADLIRQEVEDVNSFLNRIYDYVRNGLTNEVIEVGRKVEDINDYLHGDVWNKLVTIHSRIEGLYNEANYIESLIQGHDATVQAMLINLKSYLQDMNSHLSNKIDSVKNEILQKLDPIESNVEDILDNTEALIAYFHCSSPNEVCTRLQNIETEANTIHTKVNELQDDVNELRSISVYEFHQIRSKLDTIENNVIELKQLVDCATYPSSPICVMLNSVLNDTNEIKQKLNEINDSMFDLYKEVKKRIDEAKTIATGGGGGGPSAVKPIKVVYKSGNVYVAIPEYVPSGKYIVQYTGELYRYVEKPEPGKEIEINDGILELKLRPGVRGVVSGDIILKSRRGYYRIKVDVVADERLNQKVMIDTTSNKITIDVPKGGAIVTFHGALKDCAPSEKLVFMDGGKKTIKLKCSADGVIEIQPRDLRQATIQISVSQRPSIITEKYDLMSTTVIPIAGFVLFLYVLSLLGLI